MRRLKFFSLVLIPLGSMACQPMTARDAGQTAAGVYDTESRYDMSAFQGIFGNIAGQWRAPDTAISSAIIGQVRSQYGETVASTFNTLYGNQLRQDVTGYLTREAPPWLFQIGSGLDSVDAQIKTVDMQTTMLISENEDAYKATQIWNGIAVFDDPKCRDSGGIACAQTSLTSESLLDSEYPVEILSSDYIANVNGDQMVIESGSLDFNYGRLGLVLLTNQLFPAQASEGVGMREVVLGAVNCRGLAGRLTSGEDTLGFNVAGVDIGLSLSDLIGNCETGVVSQVNGFVDNFDIPLGMNLQGQARLNDLDFDGKIDQINEGNVAGDMSMQFLGQAKDGPVNGRFIGFRVGDIE